jgi:hypothetical protein
MDFDPLPAPYAAIPCDFFGARLLPARAAPPQRPVVIEYREYLSGVEHAAAFGVPDIRELHAMLGAILAEVDKMDAADASTARRGPTGAVDDQ